MSHASGLVRFEDGTIRHFEYDGTSDFCHPKLWRTFASMDKHWHEDHPLKECTCGRAPEKVAAFTHYGGGMSWQTTACRHCGVIVDCDNPYELGEDLDGVPEWVKNAK